MTLSVFEGHSAKGALVNVFVRHCGLLPVCYCCLLDFTSWDAYDTVNRLQSSALSMVMQPLTLSSLPSVSVLYISLSMLCIALYMLYMSVSVLYICG